MAVALAILIFVFVRDSVSLTKVGDLQLMNSCAVGDEVQNEHVTCVCTPKSIYRCVHKYHSVVNMTIEPVVPEETFCQPNKLYEYDSVTCICTETGTWPHKKCAELLQSLPESELVKKTCEPNAYATVDCNVCRCDANGNVDKEHCTKNTCNSDVGTSERRKSTKGTKLYGDCECKTWYSLAPCQFCYCVNKNKLVCNTGTRLMTNQMYLQLGAYNLHICGTDLLKELKNLVRDNEDTLRQGDNNIDDDEEGDEKFETTSKLKTLPKPTDKPVIFDSKSERSAMREEYSGDVDDSSLISDDNMSEQGKVIDSKSNVVERFTEQPFQDDDENQENESYEPAIGRQSHGHKLVSESDKDVPDNGLPIPTPKDMRAVTVTPKSSDSLIKVSAHSSFSLPMMLDKVFKMALRKSMVTVNEDIHCTPGSVETVQCNTCFCLKNSKMLCTKKKCD